MSRILRIFRTVCLLAPAAGIHPGASAAVREVWTSAELDSVSSHAVFPGTSWSKALYERPSYAIWLQVQQARPAALETHADSDDLLLVRHGHAKLRLGEPARLYEIGPGDFVKVPRGTPHRIDPGNGRIEWIAVRIFPSGENIPPPPGIRPEPGKMADVLRKSEIDATLAKFTTNQPIHTARNFTMNYVIYPAQAGPWEAHAGCVDLYFLQTGTATAQIGGVIQHAEEVSPGEPRGDAIQSAREYSIGPGDVVLIPRNTAHHIDPGPGKLGYVLVKIWVETEDR